MENQVAETIKINVDRDPATGRFTARVDQPGLEHKPGRIVIKTEKVLDGFVLRRKLIEFEGILPSSQLPTEYKTGMWIEKYFYGIRFGGFSTWEKGKVISEEDFQARLEYIRKCGQRLHEINSKTREIRRDWSGEEIFVI
jgi:hypothetical protein